MQRRPEEVSQYSQQQQQENTQQEFEDDRISQISQSKYSKGQIILYCQVHQEEIIERICMSPKCPYNILLCYECSLDNIEHVTEHRKYLIPLKRFPVKVGEEYQKKKKLEEKMNVVPQEVQKILGEQNQKETEFTQHLIDQERQLDRDLKEIQETLQTTCIKMQDSIGGILDSQKNIFLDNYMQFTQKVEERYNLHYPSVNDIEYTLSQLDTYSKIQQYIVILKDGLQHRDPVLEMQMFNKMTASIRNALTAPPSIRRTPKLEEKLIEVREKIKELIEQLHQTYLDALGPSLIREMNKNEKQLKNTSTTSDKLAGFIDFNDTHGIKLSHVKKVQVPGGQSIQAITIVENQIIVTGGQDGKLRLWRFPQGEPISTLEGHQDAIWSLCTFETTFSNLESKSCISQDFMGSEGVTLVGSGGGSYEPVIVLWDIKAKRQINKLVGHSGCITCIIQLEDGQTLISSSYDKSIMIWNALTGKPITKLMKHLAQVSCVRLLRCKRRFASAGWDQAVNIYKINYEEKAGLQLFSSCDVERTIQESCPILSLNSSSNYPNLIIVGTSEKKIRVWNLETGQKDQEIQGNQQIITEVVLLESRQPKSAQEDFFILTSSHGDEGSVKSPEHEESTLRVINTNPKMQIIEGEGLPKQQQLYLAILNSAENKSSFSIHKILST